MTVKITTHLNKAAFYMLKGAVLDSFEGDHWSNARVVLLMDKELINEINKTGDYSISDYRKYMDMRSKLKEKERKAFGAPSLIRKDSPFAKKLKNGRNI